MILFGHVKGIQQVNLAGNVTASFALETLQIFLFSTNQKEPLYAAVFLSAYRESYLIHHIFPLREEPCLSKRGARAGMQGRRNAAFFHYFC